MRGVEIGRVEAHDGFAAFCCYMCKHGGSAGAHTQCVIGLAGSNTPAAGTPHDREIGATPRATSSFTTSTPRSRPAERRSARSPRISHPGDQGPRGTRGVEGVAGHGGGCCGTGGGRRGRRRCGRRGCSRRSGHGLSRRAVGRRGTRRVWVRKRVLEASTRRSGRKYTCMGVPGVHPSPAFRPL
jgi:hypothetical protein